MNPRHRAMLREMGVRVWQPQAESEKAAPPPAVVVARVETHAAIDLVAAHSRTALASGTFNPSNTPKTEKSPAAPPRPAFANPSNPASPTASPTSSPVADGGPSAWRVGPAQALYADAGASAAQETVITEPARRWLVLVEAGAAALQAESFYPLGGDAGKLLDNMLRATGLHQAGAALAAPLVRGQGAGTELPALVAELLASSQSNMVLVMGRLAAQALLQSSEPFGKLRGQVHRLHGVPAIVTLDAAYLLRNPHEKARAWDDLCLAISAFSPH